MKLNLASRLGRCFYSRCEAAWTLAPEGLQQALLKHLKRRRPTSKEWLGTISVPFSFSISTQSARARLRLWNIDGPSSLEWTKHFVLRSPGRRYVFYIFRWRTAVCVVLADTHGFISCIQTKEPINTSQPFRNGSLISQMNPVLWYLSCLSD